MEELMRMFVGFTKELQDYEDLSNIDFLMKHESYFKDETIKEYKLYLSNNEGDELLDFEEWKEEYEEEIGDELIQGMIDFFTSYGIEIYKSDDNFIVDIVLAGGGPNISIRIESKWEKVIWKGIWGVDRIEKDLSVYYNTILDIYFLNEILGE